MFINCPYCNALVATDPATDVPPERCPRCASLLRRPPEVVAEFHVTALPPSPEDPQAGMQASLLGDGDGVGDGRGVEGAGLAAAVVDVPVVAVPAGEMPVVAEPAAEESAVEESSVEEPAFEERAVEEPAVEEPAVELPATAAPPIAAPPPAKLHVRYVFRTAPVIQPTPAAPIEASLIDAAPLEAAPLEAALLKASLEAAPLKAAPSADTQSDPPVVHVRPDAAQVAAGMAQAAAVQQVLGDASSAGLATALAPDPPSAAVSTLPAAGAIAAVDGDGDSDANVDADGTNRPIASPKRSRRATRPAAAGAPASAAAPSFVRRRPGAGRTQWPGWRTGVALGGLSLLLLLQLVLADREALAADPRWRPAMATLCGVLGCSLPAWHEPSAMTLLARDVRPHASIPGVLRVSASFRNDARWAQAWPALQLTLADVEGRSAGTRTFAPRDYLGAAPTQPLLAPGQVATIAMDVVEPGPSSVAFTFDFH